ncbi:MAG: type II CAAX endopeptidase family protein [Massilia sp.]
MTPATPARAMWLLARLRLVRVLNMLTTVRFGRKKDPAKRAATPAKRRLGMILPILVFAAMTASFGNMARQSVLNLQCHLAPASACLALNDRHEEKADLELAAAELHETPFALELSAALTLQLALLMVVSVLVPLGSRELAQPDWDLEWLVTLPVRRSTLLWGRLLERTLANPTGLLALGPLCTMLAWYSGYRWNALPLGVVGALCLLPLSALLRTLADTGLRMALPPSQLRNLQALAGFLALPFMYLAIGFSLASATSLLMPIARAMPTWSLWTPPGLLVLALNAASPAEAALAGAMLLAEVALLLWLGMRVLRRQLRHGVVASGARETGRKPARARASAAALDDAPDAAARWQRWLPASPIQRRELRLLSRDRNFLVQSLLLPLVMVGSQFMINAKAGALSGLAASPTALAATAFGLGSYMLMLSAFQTINNEGHALWLLFTFPRALDDMLKEKARLWAVLALVYPLAVFGAGYALAPAQPWATLGLMAIVVVGIPVYATIAVALGVFASDPLAQDVRTRVKPSYVYLYMALSSLYGYAIFAGAWWQKLAMMLLTVCLAQALWQKARDALPYLLDSAAAPPARVSTADGMMAAMLFFVLPGLCFILLHDVMGPGRALVLGFAAAGLLVYLLTRFIYWRGKTAGVPRIFGAPLKASFGWGAALGVLAAAAGIAYLFALKHGGWSADLASSAALPKMAVPWLVGLAVIAAPLCEEFIFRGLIFGGMRRSLPPLPAMLMSAGLFAIVHPPVSMLPVFVLGLCTAYAFQRTRTLLAPMLVHAIYNGAMIAIQRLG